METTSQSVVTLTPSAVAKIAYEWDRQNGRGKDGEAFMVQVALGF